MNKHIKRILTLFNTASLYFGSYAVTYAGDNWNESGEESY